ncbi:MAG: DUF805 domain-containing protein [Pseudomonadota bacterium]
MGPISAFTSFFTRYFDVYGRSRRSEYGWMIIIQILAFVAATILYGITDGGTDSLDLDAPSGMGAVIMGMIALVSVGTIIPWLTLSIRRFHDMGHTGWLAALFIGLWIIPPIGALGSIVQFFWLLFGGGTPGVNEHGQDPRLSQGLDFV